MRVKWEIQRKSGVLDLGDNEYTDAEIQEIVDEHIAHEAEALWEKMEPKK
jgi:hypothetical protein